MFYHAVLCKIIYQTKEIYKYTVIADWTSLTLTFLLIGPVEVTTVSETRTRKRPSVMNDTSRVRVNRHCHSNWLQAVLSQRKTEAACIS